LVVMALRQGIEMFEILESNLLELACK
jgi:hypothetical protein